MKESVDIYSPGLIKIVMKREIRYGMLPLVVWMLSVTACTEEEHFAPDKQNSYTEELTFGADELEGWEDMTQTRAESSLLSHKSIEYKEKIEGYTFILSMEEYDGIEEAPAPVVTTKSYHKIPDDDVLDMGVYAYITKKGEETVAPEYDGSKSVDFMVAQFVDISNGYSYSPVKYWPGAGYWIDFFAYRPYIDNINKGSAPYLVIDASDKEPEMSYTVPKDIDHQVDLLASSVGTLDGNHKQKITFRFSHLLSAVKFKVGSIPATIVEVALNGVALKGNSAEMKSDGAWTSIEGTEDFVQSGLSVSGKEDAGKQIGKTFYMLPYTFPDDAELSITIRFDAPSDDTNHSYHEYTLKAPLNEFCDEWEQGKTYTYTITTPEEVDLEIDEDFIQHSSVKENVHFINTGLAAANIRATIVGYWVVKSIVNGVEEECIIAAWNPEDDGTFEGLPGTGWTKNDSDGFYYYGPSVPSQEKTANLFDSYTLKGNPPAVGAELVLTIVGQSVMSGYEGQSWSTANTTSGN